MAFSSAFSSPASAFRAHAMQSSSTSARQRTRIQARTGRSAVVDVRNFLSLYVPSSLAAVAAHERTFSFSLFLSLSLSRRSGL